MLQQSSEIMQFNSALLGFTLIGGRVWVYSSESVHIGILQIFMPQEVNLLCSVHS